MKRVLLLSAYHADSHAAWTNWLKANIRDVEWISRTLPGRHFAWRIRGNAMSWLDELDGLEPNLILATSMVDLATLKGINPDLTRVPAWYYFHENQFAYPVSKRQTRSIEPAMVQVYGALAADRLMFNSDFNRRTFLDGIAPFLAQMPDGIPHKVAGRIAPKCEVLPVPVEPVAATSERDPSLIVWNHRWEYDKRPELFARAMCRLAEEGTEFRLALLGKRPRQAPPALAQIRDRLADRIVADGRVSRRKYEELLGRAGIAVSTAAHEFQGISMLEAASAGARPVVPDALCFPEQYPAEYRYPAGDLDALVERLQQWIEQPPPACDVAPWLSAHNGAKWQAALSLTA